MVLAPFFLAFGAFGGGLFVASPCVMGVVVCCGVCRRERCVCVCVATCGGAPRRCATASEGPLRAGGGVCVCAGANGAAVCGNVRRRGVFVCQRRWRRCGASLGRCAAAGEARGAGARGPLVSSRMSSRRPFQTPPAHENGSHDVAYCWSTAGALLVCCGAVHCAVASCKVETTKSIPVRSAAVLKTRDPSKVHPEGSIRGPWRRLAEKISRVSSRSQP